MKRRWIIIFIFAMSFLWAQEIRPKPQNVPMCEITIVPVESLFNIKSISIISPTYVYLEPDQSSSKPYVVQVNQSFSVNEIKDGWYKIAQGWVQKSKVRVNYNDRFKPIGRILYVADSFLVFLKGKTQYDSRLINDFSIKIPYSEIEKVSIKPTRKDKLLWALPGGAIGCLTGAAVGVALTAKEPTGNTENDFVNLFNQGLAGGCCMIVGGLGVGLISSYIMTNKNIMINSEYPKYNSALLALKKLSVFPFAPPSELQPFLEK